MNRANKYEEMWEIITSMAKTKMLMNAHKGNIEDLETSDLICRAIDELKELNEAIDISDSDYLGVIEEAADVLNYTTAAVFKAVHHYRGRKKDG